MKKIAPKNLPNKNNPFNYLIIIALLGATAALFMQGELETALKKNEPIAISELQQKFQNNELESLEIKDQKLKALSHFTKAMVKERGKISKNQMDEFLNNGYSTNDVLAIITGIGVKTMSNYFNQIMQTPLDDVFESRVWNTNT